MWGQRCWKLELVTDSCGPSNQCVGNTPQVLWRALKLGSHLSKPICWTRKENGYTNILWNSSLFISFLLFLIWNLKRLALYVCVCAPLYLHKQRKPGRANSLKAPVSRGSPLKMTSPSACITRMQTEEAAHARSSAKGLRWGSLGKARQWPAPGNMRRPRLLRNLGSATLQYRSPIS